MRRNLNVTNEAGVTPDVELIIRHSMAGDKLAVAASEKKKTISKAHANPELGFYNLLGTPLQTGNLAVGVNRVHARSGRRVPEVNAAIIVSTTAGKEVQLPRAPSECLDGRPVVSLCPLGGLN